MKDQIKAFLLSTGMKRLYWNTLAGFFSVAAIYVGGLNLWYAPLLFALFNGLTKEINKYNLNKQNVERAIN